MVYKNYKLCIYVILLFTLIIFLNCDINISKIYNGGIKSSKEYDKGIEFSKNYNSEIYFLDKYEMKLKKTKDKYRIIIHNIILMEKILKYNKLFSNNYKFMSKFNNLKLKRNKEYSNLINILDSISMAKEINDKFKKEEKKSAEQYARFFTAKQIQLKKYSNINYDNIYINNEINNIKLLE